MDYTELNRLAQNYMIDRTRPQSEWYYIINNPSDTEKISYNRVIAERLQDNNYLTFLDQLQQCKVPPKTKITITKKKPCEQPQSQLRAVKLLSILGSTEIASIADLRQRINRYIVDNRLQVRSCRLLLNVPAELELSQSPMTVYNFQKEILEELNHLK